MAHVIITDQSVNSRSFKRWAWTAGLGFAAGTVFWLATLLLTHYVVEPLTCTTVTQADNCTNATSLAGNVVTVLLALAAVVVMVRGQLARPIVVAIGSAALLWNLAYWTTGLFWVEALAWSAVLYAFCYGLFAWISRYGLLWVTILLSVLIVIFVRVLLAMPA